MEYDITKHHTYSIEQSLCTICERVMHDDNNWATYDSIDSLMIGMEYQMCQECVNRIIGIVAE